MPHKRAQVTLPDDLLADVDALVGSPSRTAFLIEAIRDAVNRRRLLDFLSTPEPAWKDEDHPELADGAETWVRKMRDDDVRIQREKLGDWVVGGESVK
jgi:hypothetical protein